MAKALICRLVWHHPAAYGPTVFLLPAEGRRWPCSLRLQSLFPSSPWPSLLRSHQGWTMAAAVLRTKLRCYTQSWRGTGGKD